MLLLSETICGAILYYCHCSECCYFLEKRTEHVIYGFFQAWNQMKPWHFNAHGGGADHSTFNSTATLNLPERREFAFGLFRICLYLDLFLDTFGKQEYIGCYEFRGGMFNRWTNSFDFMPIHSIPIFLH